MRVDQTGFLETVRNTNTSEGKSNTVSVKEYNRTEKVSESAGYTVNMKDSTYDKPTGESAVETIRREAEMEKDSITARQDEMAVLSNSMSPEDYRELEKNGFSPEDTDSHTIVTVVDKIKMELAASGVDISGMGGDLSDAVIEEYAGNQNVAGQIERSLKEADIPATEENISDGKNAYEMAMSLTGLSDGAVKYMVDNGLKPDIAGLYKAENGTAAGYGENTLSVKETEELTAPILEVVNQAGYQGSEEALEQGKWMIANDIPLTAENLQKVMELRGLSFPLSAEQVTKAMTEAVAEGRRPEEAYLVAGYSINDQAAQALETIQNVTDEDLKYLVFQNMEFTIENLRLAAAVRQTAETGKALENSLTGQFQAEPLQPEQLQTEQIQTGPLQPEQIQTGQLQPEGVSGTENEKALITARRQLEETRLMMTLEANRSLLKQGISIDTRPLQELVEQLKGIEDQYYKQLLTNEGAAATDENAAIFRETMDTVRDLESMPAYAMGIKETDEETLRGLYRTGAAMEAELKKAGDSYETMRTEVRTDLGDSMKKAFGNVDGLLYELGMEKTPVNERAVKILGYNNLEITEESVQEMKALDEEVQRTFKNMTPQVVAKLIKEQINPLDLELTELNQTAEALKAQDGTAEEARFSEYLWKLEQNHEFTPEERNAYIGIYRLMNQVEKTDGAAIGALLNQGLDVTMRNLLTEVRSSKKTGMDYAVDDENGSVEAAKADTSITDQIEKAFQTNCVRDIMDIISPENLTTVMSETNWEEATPEEFYRELAGKDTVSEDEKYVSEQLKHLQAAGSAEEDVYRMLEEFDIPNTVSNVLAAQEFLANRSKVFQKFFGMENSAYTQEEDGKDLETIKQELIEEFGEAVKSPEELARAQKKLADTAENIMKTMVNEYDRTTSLDLRELKLMNAQIALGNKMMEKESYNIPVLIQGENGAVSLKIVHGEDQKGTVDILLTHSMMGAVAAKFKTDGNRINGLVAAENEETKQFLESHEDELAEALKQSMETEKSDAAVDIHYIADRGLDTNRLNADSRSNGTASGSEEQNSVATRALYQMAKSFIDLIQGFEKASDI